MKVTVCVYYLSGERREGERVSERDRGKGKERNSERWRERERERGEMPNLPKHGLVLNPPVSDPFLPLLGCHLVLVQHSAAKSTTAAST